MSEIVLTTPDTTDSKQEISALAKQSVEIVEVTTKEENEFALVLIRDMTKTEKRIVDMFKKPKSSANKAHKDICALERELLQPLRDAKKLLNSRCSTYEREQERKAEAERRRLEEEQRRQREEEALMDAIAAQDSGDNDDAEAIVEAPQEIEKIEVEPEVAKVEGVSKSKRWSAEVTDKMALIRYVAENPEWQAFVEPAMKELNRLAVSMRENMSIPGVRAVSKTVRSVKA